MGKMADVIYKAKLLHSLVKVFSDEEPKSEPMCNRFTSLKNETVSFQIALSKNGKRSERLFVEVEYELKECLHIRTVENVPVQYPAHPKFDDNYLRTAPGLYPDILRELWQNTVLVVPGQWRALWIDVEISPHADAGTYPICISFFDSNSEMVCSVSAEITVYDAVLPEQKLIQTQWFHCDCLAEYYGVEVFSEDFWEIVRNFIKTYVKRGFNMILTPIFTPPLDTAVGGERKTVQLVQVRVSDGVYHFDFSNLKRWVNLCRENGIKYFEMSHLFTQWGAAHAPKIMATVDGEYRRIFGWETNIQDGEYAAFLDAFLPRLIAFLKEEGIAQDTYFHISDEPNLEMLESYAAAKSLVAHHLREFKIIDALSEYDFYETGLLDRVVCANNRIHRFLDKNVENMWVYYCTSQWKDVSNRFISMPSARTRIYGIQLYRYNIEGTLHWGYNFYNSQHSRFAIDPYQVTDAGCAFPAVDPFIVYPGADKRPEESLRLMILQEAVCDLRALQMLESLTSREYVIGLIEEDLSEPLTFLSYPKSDWYILSLRNKVNKEIAQRINAAL
ncbi:MAG: DUF4091 domain-containing protein [Clostridiales bacterium]|nr:DUF4091 domain-containing protein [Clostridiales bacterium]